MGLYLSNYVGPVLLAKYTEATRPVPFWACAKPECSKYRKTVDGSFCTQCGSRLSAMTDPSRTEKVRKPTQEERWAALEKTGGSDDRLIANGHVKGPDGWHVYVPNIKGPREEPDYPANFMLDINDVDIESDKLWFVETFAKEIEAMASVYEQVEVHWVFMNYES